MKTPYIVILNKQKHLFSERFCLGVGTSGREEDIRKG
jgi:hypothetical protein